MLLPILEQALVALPLLLGAYITHSLLKLPDFSIESAYLFGGVIGYIAKDLGLTYALLGGALGGAFVGGIVTTLHHYGKLPFLLAAIVTNGLFHGFTQYLFGTSMKSFHLTLSIAEPVLFIIVGLCTVAVIGCILRSQLGYSFAVYGSNPTFFEHHRISGRYVTFLGVMIGHGCAGVGGILFGIFNGFVDLTMNFGIVLLCLTTLILGKTLIRRERPTFFIPLVGLVAYFCMQQTLVHIGLNLKYFNSFQALFIVAFLSLQRKKISLNHLGV